VVEVCDVKLGFSVGPLFSGEMRTFKCLHFSQGAVATDLLDGLCGEIQTSHADQCVSKVDSLIKKRDKVERIDIGLWHFWSRCT
jgi:hypothetical protein